MLLIKLENKVTELFDLASKRDDVETVKKIFSNYIYKYIVYTKRLKDLFFIAAVNDSEKIFDYMLRKKYSNDLREQVVTELVNEIILESSPEIIDKYISKLLKKESLNLLVRSQITESLKILCGNGNGSKIQLLFTDTFLRKSENISPELEKWLFVNIAEGKNTTILLMSNLIEKNKLSESIKSVEVCNIKQKLKL